MSISPQHLKADARDRHWTARSTEDLRYSVGASLLCQIQKAIDLQGITQKQIAQRMKVSESAVSQLLTETRNNNFTLDSVLRLSEAVGMKAALVLYPSDARGSGAPIDGEVFARCWQDAGRPEDFWKWHSDEGE